MIPLPVPGSLQSAQRVARVLLQERCDAWTNAVSARPKVEVTAWNGRVDTDEARRAWMAQGWTVFVTIAGRDDVRQGNAANGARLLVYLAQAVESDEASDPWAVDLVDLVETTLRDLPGRLLSNDDADLRPEDDASTPSPVVRAPLSVRSANLYDAKDGELGLRLWAVSAVWPSLAAAGLSLPGSAAELPPALHAQVNAALAPALDRALEITALGDAVRAARRGETEAQRRQLDWAGPLPSARIVHEASELIGSPVRVIYEDADDGLTYRQSTEAVSWTVEVMICDAGEAVSRIERFFARLPREWEQWGQQHPIRLLGHRHGYDERLGCEVAAIRLRLQGLLARGERVQMVNAGVRIDCRIRRPA